jgi:hypothetical protein
MWRDYMRHPRCERPEALPAVRNESSLERPYYRLQIFQDAVWGRCPRWPRSGFGWSMQRLIGGCGSLGGDHARNRDARVYVVVAVK